MDKNRLCIIAGRAGSKRLPNKNMLPLGRKPMVAHAVLQAAKTGLFKDIAISSDSSEIVSAAQQAGANIFIFRPPELASDEASSFDVIKHALVEAELKTGKEYDNIIFLQITSPLRLAEDIIKAVEGFEAADPPVPSLISVAEVKNIIGVKGSAYQINGAIYIWDKNSFLTEPKHIYPGTKFLVMPPHRSVDIDYRHDYEIAKFLFESNLSKEGESALI